MTDQGKSLQRLAETHVVGQDAAEPVLPQERQPGETLLLIAPQIRSQHCWRLGRADALGGQQSVDLLLPRGGLMVSDAEPRELIPQAGLIAADPQLSGRRILQRPGL